MVDPIFKAACVQMNAGPDITENLQTAEQMIREAAAQGAEFIATPENTCQIRFRPEEKLETAHTLETHPAIPLFKSLAKELNIWLLAGSLTIKAPEANKLLNRSILFSAAGDIAAQYDKIHLFDVTLNTNETYKESATIQPGNKAVIAQTPWSDIGMSICYDVRFSKLYRDLAQNGAKILTIPAAFTIPTGQAHWETLLRARAIETGSFVIAPAQTGTHEKGRQTYGHSMIINPWGEILAQAGNQPEIITAQINLEDVTKARQSIPSLQHDRRYEIQK